VVKSKLCEHEKRQLTAYEHFKLGGSRPSMVQFIQPSKHWITPSRNLSSALGDHRPIEQLIYWLVNTLSPFHEDWKLFTGWGNRVLLLPSGVLWFFAHSEHACGVVKVLLSFLSFLIQTWTQVLNDALPMKNQV
jgi:hypothetical protein